MMICHKHDALYNEKKGGCEICCLRLSDPMDVCVKDIVRVENEAGFSIVTRGRVEQIGTQGMRDWIIYDLDRSSIKVISMGCVVTKLEETYETARRN